MRAYRLDQGEIAGRAGDSLAFLAIALADDLADQLAERPALVAQRLEPTGIGGGDVAAQPLFFGLLPAQRLAVHVTPSGPQSIESGNRRRIDSRRGAGGAWREEREADQEGARVRHRVG